MGLDQHLQSVSVGCHIPLKPPLLTQHPVEQPVIDVRRDAINFVIRDHHTAGMRLFDGSLEGNQKRFANDSLGIVPGSSVGAAFWLSLDRKIFRRRYYVVPITAPSCPLHS